jgi:hypothetical protein
VSASLDDMPEYERFQDELDHELSRYKQLNSITDTHIENDFIQYVCFSLFIGNTKQFSDIILKNILNEFNLFEDRIIAFLTFMNEDNHSYLKNRFSEVLHHIKK